jgi:prepilin-type N-terminal cleavage/methylation domain-containing protein
MTTRKGFTLIEPLAVVAVIAVLIALLVTAVQSARESAARTQCIHNQKLLALACHSFHDTYRKLPPGIGWEATGDQVPPPAFGTGFFHLLPFVEQEPLYKSSNNDGFFFADYKEVSATVVGAFQCPSDPSTPSDGLITDGTGASPSGRHLCR